jgi:hypothetical protein
MQKLHKAAPPPPVVAKTPQIGVSFMRCSEGREVVEHCSHPPLFAVVVCVSAGPLEPHVLARVGAVMDDFLTMGNLRLTGVCWWPRQECLAFCSVCTGLAQAR